MKAKIEGLARKIDLLLLALGHMETAANDDRADGLSVGLHDVVAVKDLAEEIRAAVNTVYEEVA